VHIFFVGEDIPFNGKSGSCIHGWTLIQYFLSAGHKVTAIVNPPGWEPDDREAHIKILSSLGVRVVSLFDVSSYRPKRSKLLRILNPRIGDYYHTVYYRKEIRNVIEKYVEQLRPHIIVAFGIAAMCVTQHITTTPRVAPICENPFVWNFAMLRYKRNYFNPLDYLRYLKDIINSHRVLKRIISVYTACQIHGTVAKDFVENFRRLGATHCKYYKAPYIDPVGENWRDLRERAHAKNKKPKILMIGMVGTATYIHYKNFADYILPRLEEKLGSDAFEVHLIGNVTIPGEFQQKLNRPSVIVRGYVDDIAEDFLSADLLLVPTPAQLASRARIIVGLAYGCCVVTTIFEKNSRPELVHMENALIANDIRELPELIIKVINDEQLRKKIENNARLTYEQNFVPEVAVREMEDDMKNIVKTFPYPEDYFICRK